MDPGHPVYISHSCVDVAEEYTAVSSHTHFSGSYDTTPPTPTILATYPSEELPGHYRRTH